MSLKDSLSEFFTFAKFVHREVPAARMVFSLPLFTNNARANDQITSLRSGLNLLTDNLDACYKIIVNTNMNFHCNGLQVREYFSNDGIHLSDKGKDLLLGNMRHHIHDLTAQILNKPRRKRLRVHSGAQH